MRQTTVGLAVAAALATGVAPARQPQPTRSGAVLAEMTWPMAEAALTPDAVVVLPLGGSAVQHGPHLPLDTDARIAASLAQRVRAASDVVIAPALPYHFYPTHLAYPGSTSLARTAARDLTADVVRSLAKYGPRRFYVLNTGITTTIALSDAAALLADQGILLGYTDFAYRVNAARVPRQQAAIGGATHADEVETSMMLLVDPAAVDMRKAVREYGSGSGALTRQKDGPGRYSASGVVGDPTVATREKGQAFLDAVVAGALEDIENLRTARLPAAKTTVSVPAAPAPRAGPRGTGPAMANGCTPADERAIRDVGDRFSYLWRQMDADKLAEMFAPNGDMRHPDGTIERGRDVLRQNRQALFAGRDFRGSVHPVSLTDIRCLSNDVAIADGKWELRLEDTPTTGAPARNLGPGRRHSGLCTLVLSSSGGGWLIQAWRYTVNPLDGTPPPTTLKQPGFIGRGGP